MKIAGLMRQKRWMHTHFSWTETKLNCRQLAKFLELDCRDFMIQQWRRNKLP